MKKILLLFFVILPSCGMLPSHLHNPSREASAVESQQLMKEYAQKAPGMYDAMLENLELFKLQEDFLLAELTKNYESSLATKGPSKSWVDFIKELELLEFEANTFDTRIANEVTNFLNEMGINITESKLAAKKVEEAQKAVEQMRKTVDQWSQLNALLRDAFARLPDVLKELQQEDKQDGGSLEKIADSLNKLGKTKISYVNSKGNKEEKEINKIVVNTASLFRKSNISSTLPNAPGIDLIILNLGLELAEVEQKKAKAKLDSLVARASLFEEALIIRNVTKLLISNAINKARAFTDSTPLRSILRQYNDRNNEAKIEITNNIISSVLFTVRIASLSQSLLARSKASLRLGLARLNHHDSIVKSSINDEAWQAVIRSGIAGLVSYHMAGWSEEDTANLVRSAQAIALGVVSAGVL